MTRRDLFRWGGAALFSTLRSVAAPHSGKVKITDVRAAAKKDSAGNCLIRIDTDAGLVGYGEAGVSGPMARARLEQLKPMLVGQDPLSIEKHFFELTSLMHPYMAHIPTLSGIDIALWDLAGKITDQPVHTLLGGPFRDAIPMYSHGNAVKMLDKGSCREWAARAQAAPEGFRAFKFGVDQPAGVRAGRFAESLTQEQIKNVQRGFMNVREAAGDGIAIACHCHNEFDVPSALAVARAIEPMDPLFYEDPLNVPYHEGWSNLKRNARVTILTGEKLELLEGFKPFLDHQAADIVHPDLAFAGGITGTRKIAAYAQTFRIPVALHNVGTLVLCHASAHFAAGIPNFYRSESALGRPTRQVENMAAGNAPKVAGGMLTVPAGAGLGLELNHDYIKANLMPGEPYWA